MFSSFFFLKKKEEEKGRKLLNFLIENRKETKDKRKSQLREKRTFRISRIFFSARCVSHSQTQELRTRLCDTRTRYFCGPHSVDRTCRLIKNGRRKRTWEPKKIRAYLCPQILRRVNPGWWAPRARMDLANGGSASSHRKSANEECLCADGDLVSRLWCFFQEERCSAKLTGWKIFTKRICEDLITMNLNLDDEQRHVNANQIKNIEQTQYRNAAGKEPEILDRRGQEDKKIS